MNTKHGTDKYAASRALNVLDEQRVSPGYLGDTARLPKLVAPVAGDETVPHLPALLRKQAE